jgi:nitrite reductase/ring-hydroxylating ferredoxin subunit
MGASLGSGTLHEGDLIECPAHALCFSLRTGRCAEGEPYAVRVFPVRLERGRVLVWG